MNIFEMQAIEETRLGQSLNSGEYLFVSGLRRDNPDITDRTVDILLDAFRKGYEYGYDDARLTFDKEN